MKKKKERAHKVVRKNAGRLKKPTGQEIKGIKEGGEGREKERPGVGDSKCETASRKAAKVVCHALFNTDLGQGGELVNVRGCRDCFTTSSGKPYNCFQGLFSIRLTQ